MDKNKILYILTFIAFVVFLSICIFVSTGIFLRSQEEPVEPEQKITNEIILEKITNEAFVVTKTIFLDQETEIVIDQGSAWSNFWWGQKISAEAIIRVDLGVDFSKLSEENIQIDEVNKVISIILPVPEILDASLNGDIEVVTQNGVLKQLLKNNPNEDFNLALEKLLEDAKRIVGEDEDLNKEAKEDSIKILQLVLKDLGYEIEVVENFSSSV